MTAHRDFDDRAYRIVDGRIREIGPSETPDPRPGPQEDDEPEFRCNECLGINEHRPNCPNDDDWSDDDP